METFNKTPLNTVKRIPARGRYDKETVFEILDAARVGHVGFVVEGRPFVIPTLYGRKDDILYLHGATTSRMLQQLEQGIPVCLTVTHEDGLVLARSVFHHSMNYRSAMVFGTARIVAAEDKLEALRVITERMMPGRWDEVRLPNAKELKATTVLALEIETASAKVRSGPPKDDAEDYGLPVWAGVLPMLRSYGPPETDPDALREEEVSESVRRVTG
jgi:nitroimidazol reductase NimA-like FMN-containing flavoprotein (pyridoxamine 5'-phosphate oxidase superfamily)